MSVHWTLTTWRAAFFETWSKRRAFWVDVITMCVNNLFWLAFWGVFFETTGSVKGWDAQRIFVFFAIVTAIFGVVAGLFANVRHIGRMIADGELDAALTVPVDTLTYLLLRRVNSSHVGDALFGCALFAAVGDPTPERIALFAAAVVAGSVVLASFLVFLGSLTFFVGGDGAQAQLGFDAVGLFSMYPIEFFGGVAKMLIFTVIPTAFIVGVPSRLVANFSWVDAGTLALVAVCLAAVARATFTLGLRRYRSGSSWTAA